MSVSARFVADFSSFTSAVDKAETKLSEFRTESAKVEGQLKRMGDSFSGKKILSDATLAVKAVTDLGGVTKLTDAEQKRLNATVSDAIAKYKALGQEAPADLIAIEQATRRTTEATDKMAAGMAAMGVQGKKAFENLQASDKLIEGMSAAGKAVTDVGAKTSVITTKMLALGTAIGTAVGNVAVGAVQSLGRALGQAAANGQQFSQLSVGFDALTASIGTTRDVMLSTTRTATKGLVSDLDLMQVTNKAVLLGLPVTAAEMGKLSGAAVTLGRAMGKDAVSSVNDLITALGRSSPQILDNLGLTVKVGEANERYARQLGISVSELSDAERKTAFYNAAMDLAEKKTQDLGDAQLTVTDQLNRMLTALGNIVTRIAAAGNEAKTFSDLLGQMAKAAETLAMRLEDLIEVRKRLGASLFSDIPTSPQGAATGAGSSLIDKTIRAIFGVDVNILTKEGEELNRVAQEKAMELATAHKPSLGAALLPKVDKDSGFISSAGMKLSGPTSDEIRKIAEVEEKLADARKKLAAETLKAKEAQDRWTDSLSGKKTSEDIRYLEKAFLQISAAGGANNQIIGDVIDQYDKLRTSAGAQLSPALEQLRTQFHALSTEGKKWDESYRSLDHTMSQWVQTGDDANETTKTSIGLYEAMPAQINSQAASFEDLIPATQMSTEAIRAFATQGQDSLTKFFKTINSQNVSKELDKTTSAFGSFFAGITGGFKKLWEGMSGGGGISGLFKNIGGGVSQGIGQIISQGLAGGLTGLINAGVGLLGKGLTKLFGGLFGGGEAKKVNDLRDKAFEAAGGFDALNEKAAKLGFTLDSVLKPTKIKDWENAWTDLQAKFDEAEADQLRLNAAIEKYGFSLEQLGPQLQKSKLDEQAKELIEDWRVLVSAGIDVATVNEKMAESINEYLQTALKVGAEVPAAMKPILEAMAAQGTLVDENGVAITDLGKAGVKFSESMTQGFDRVVRKLDELITKLQATGAAISNIPSSVDVAVNEHVSRSGTFTQDGQDNRDQPGYARGTRGRYLDFGAGTSVMLHGKERVMTEGESDTSSNSDLLARLARMPSEISRAVQRGVADALVLAPRSR